MKDISPQSSVAPVVHLGVMKKSSGLLGKVDSIFDRVDDKTNKLFSYVSGKYKHEKRVEKILKEIDFDYLHLILKKMVKNSASANGAVFKDFKLDEESVAFDSGMKSMGSANFSNGKLKVNPFLHIKSAEERSVTEENLKLEILTTVAHEAVHLLAVKEKDNSGFEDNKGYVSLNEAMTELLARGVREAYNDFTKEENQEGWLFESSYSDDIKYLVTLMVIVARDNGVSVETVIQAFTTSYFSDSSVLDNFSGFANISKEAAFVVEKLKHKQAEVTGFDIEEIGLDQETRSEVEQIMSDNGKERNRIVRRALHI